METNLRNDWYVVYTIPNNEKKVFAELNKRSVQAFLPMHTIIRQWSDRKKKLDTPLFPNYLFVKIPDQQLWSLLTINGVVRLVSFSGRPAIVKDTEIEAIRIILSKGGEVMERDNLINIGENVHVTRGPFAGLKGKVLAIKGKLRFCVELEAISKALSIDVTADMLEVIA